MFLSTGLQLTASQVRVARLWWPGPGPRDYGLVEGFLPFLPPIVPWGLFLPVAGGSSVHFHHRVPGYIGVAPTVGITHRNVGNFKAGRTP